MKVAVMSAGGVGGYYGALLAGQGHDVSFVARGSHLAAIRQNGLTIRSVHGDLAVRPARATDEPRTIGPVDWILFAVKTYDTEAATEAISPMLRDGTCVITFQNGVESADRIGNIIGRERVVVAPTQIVSNIAEAGVIWQRSQFRVLTVGEAQPGLTPRIEQIASAFRSTGVDASASPDVRKPLWHKFVFIASIAGLASVARVAPFELLQLPEDRETLRQAMQEVFEVGVSRGVPMDSDIVERQYRFCLNLAPGQKASMQLDLEQGKRLEIDAMSGAVVRLGAMHGIATPVHRTLYAALKVQDPTV
jgi:2-dehydropantoate 2-reductase